MGTFVSKQKRYRLNQMKILIIAQYFPPDMGGGATRAYNMAKGLTLAGCDVTVVTAFPHYPTGDIPKKYKRKLLSIEGEEKIKIIRTFVPPIASEGITKRIILFTSFILSSLFALPIVRKIDVVWAANPNIIAMISSMIYKLFNSCPTIQNVDDLWPETLYDLGLNDKSITAKITELIAKITYNFASALTPISPAYVPVLTKKYNLAPHKITVIPPGVDLSLFSHTVCSKKNTDTFRVLYIGAFSPAYNFDQVFKAADLLSGYNNIEFVIQGGGELSPHLITNAESNKHARIKVINKIVSRKEVINELNCADALLLPLNGIGSIEMGISSKLYEYQAAEKPIICCSNGQPRRYILRTNSGLVISPGNNEALAKAVITLKDNPKLAALLGKNGRMCVELESSIDLIGLRMKELFTTVL